MNIALLEVLDRDGHVKHYLPVAAWPVSAGRALDNDLVLDDPHVAAHHFHIAADEAGVFVQVGDTVNGLRTGGRRLASGERVPVGDQPMRLEVGDSHLCLRLAGHALAPEVPLRTPRSLWHALWPLGLAGLLVLAAALFTTWLETDPDDFTRALGSGLVTMTAAALTWCAGWSLLSKIFTRRSHFLWHLRVLLWGVLAIDLVGAAA
ncbi:MAG TPA: FHA domain-containing protein, partial [Albitalea sp.]|nr:FHA domain-containing protein [Albitalea sp.]